LKLVPEANDNPASRDSEKSNKLTSNALVLDETKTPVVRPLRSALKIDVPLIVILAFAATALRSRPAISDLIFIINMGVIG
jgi:hypothetical protein